MFHFTTAVGLALCVMTLFAFYRSHALAMPVFFLVPQYCPDIISPDYVRNSFNSSSDVPVLFQYFTG